MLSGNEIFFCLYAHSFGYTSLLTVPINCDLLHFSPYVLPPVRKQWLPTSKVQTQKERVRFRLISCFARYFSGFFCHLLVSFSLLLRTITGLSFFTDLPVKRTTPANQSYLYLLPAVLYPLLGNQRFYCPCKRVPWVVPTPIGSKKRCAPYLRFYGSTVLRFSASATN